MSLDVVRVLKGDKRVWKAIGSATLSLARLKRTRNERRGYVCSGVASFLGRKTKERETRLRRDRSQQALSRSLETDEQCEKRCAAARHKLLGDASTHLSQEHRIKRFRELGRMNSVRHKFKIACVVT
ncbi:hypothetical protein HF086_004371 [Spodoptera exigua]|uniref:Uncharacterized protein n=1 Tax=Spodoptera exigua TaxID=7107 RepID=A0A922M7I5_SPOEX|nr:hypothetical protein HF086_004371 [Spodoptera exigua]